MKGDDFLNRLAENGGAIVSSGDCSEVEIVRAQLRDNFYCNERGLGFVLRTADWLESRETAFFEVLEVEDIGNKKALDFGGE
jgi:hypothetical protein